MNSIYINPNHSDEVRRKRLYAGQLYIYSSRESTRAFCRHAREMTEEAFAPLDPRVAQYEMSLEDYVAVLAKLKPEFIHHPRSKELIRTILKDVGCDLEKVYFDVPRLRTSTTDSYLTSGLGYVFKPYRDTWYSPPMSQCNWWLPIYEVESDNVMAFHTRYWDKPVRNDSDGFNYQEWTQNGRKAATTQIKSDSRKQSAALEELELDPQIRIVGEPGNLLIFSAAHLHSSVPNTSGQTRFSIDFRTVHLDDLRRWNGAPNIDSECSGTTIRDYLRGSDFQQLPREVIAEYEQMTREARLLSI